MNRIPFDPYDFFGYLASGLLLIVGMDLVLGFPHVAGQNLKIADTILLVFAMYIGGQLVATPAKSVLEDLVVGRILGKPSINLFREKKPWIRWFLFPGFYKPLPKEIRDTYRIRIALTNYPFALPKIYPSGWSIHPEAPHKFNDGSICIMRSAPGVVAQRALLQAFAYREKCERW